MPEDELKREIQKARNGILRLLKLRLRSEKEIRDYLTRKDFSSPVIEETIDSFKQLDFINDQTFAKAWIASRLARPFGINRIRYELIQKGIDRELLNAQLNKAAEITDEVEATRIVAVKQNQKYAALEKNKRRQRLYNYLLRKGFKSETIIKILKEL